MKGKKMKTNICNSMLCVGDFSGPDIEEGTFHHFSLEMLNESHKKKAQKCPCPPDGSQEAETSEGSDDDKDTSNKD